MGPGIKIKDLRRGKEVIKLSLSADDMIIPLDIWK